jgi:RNA polymerase sigma-70 factor (ECF subfamily)
MPAGRTGFAEVFDAHKDAVWAFLRRQGVDPSGAEDLFQTVFLKALRAFDGFRGDAAVKTWLFTIAAHAVLDDRRSRRRTAAIEVHEAMLVAEDAAGEGLEHAETLDRLRAILDGVPPHHRVLFTLVRFEGLAIADAARAAGLTPQAAKVTLFRMSRRIGECFAREAAR